MCLCCRNYRSSYKVLIDEIFLNNGNIETLKLLASKVGHCGTRRGLREEVGDIEGVHHTQSLSDFFHTNWANYGLMVRGGGGLSDTLYNGRSRVGWRCSAATAYPIEYLHKLCGHDSTILMYTVRDGFRIWDPDHVLSNTTTTTTRMRESFR